MAGQFSGVGGRLPIWPRCGRVCDWFHSSMWASHFRVRAQLTKDVPTFQLRSGSNQRDEATRAGVGSRSTTALR